jgi:hypothetical protein
VGAVVVVSAFVLILAFSVGISVLEVEVSAKVDVSALKLVD